MEWNGMEQTVCPSKGNRPWTTRSLLVVTSEVGRVGGGLTIRINLIDPDQELTDATWRILLIR